MWKSRNLKLAWKLFGLGYWWEVSVGSSSEPAVTAWLPGSFFSNLTWVFSCASRGHWSALSSIHVHSFSAVTCVAAPLDLSTNVSGKCRWMQPPVNKLFFFFHCDWCVDSNPIPVLLLDHQSRLEDCWKYVLIPKVLQFSAGPVQAETNWFLHSTKQW